MNDKDIKRLVKMALDMANRGYVKLKDSSDNRWFIINRIDLDGNMDLYSKELNDIVYYDVPMSNVVIT